MRTKVAPMVVETTKKLTQLSRELTKLRGADKVGHRTKKTAVLMAVEMLTNKYQKSWEPTVYAQHFHSYEIQSSI